jgi:hypothetical protein
MTRESDKRTRSLVDKDGVRFYRRYENKWYKKVEIHESKGYAVVRAERLRASIGRGVRVVKVSIPHLSIYKNGAWAIYAEVKRS